MDGSNLYRFKSNVKLKRGYGNACIYDFNNRKIYLINKECSEKLLTGGAGLDAAFLSKLEDLQLITAENISCKEDSPEFFSYDLFDDAYSFKKCRLIYLEVTGYCNFSCLHCYASMTNGAKDYLTFKNAETLVEKIKEIAPCDIRLTGGEPFLNPDIDRIIDLVSQSISPCQQHSIATNGSFSLEQVKYAIDHGYEIQVSIYGMALSSFLQFTHSNTQTYYTLFEKLTQLGNTVYAQNITLAMAVNGITYSEIEDLIAFATSNGFHYILNRAASSGRATKNWDTIELDANTKHIFAQKQRKALPSFCYHLCQLFWTNIHITGEVYPCPYIREQDFSFGNLFCKDMSDIWNSQKYNEFRKLTAADVQHCQDCEFIYSCTAGCCAEALGHSKSITAVYPWCETRPYENSHYLPIKSNEIFFVEKLSAGVFDFVKV